MYGVIYRAMNILNKKVYIGQTTHSIKQRQVLHLSEARHHRRTYFHHALNKYGFEGFVWEQLAEAQTKEELDQLEIHYIQQYESTNPEKGYNGKEGGSRGKNSPTIRAKISERVRSSERFKAALRNPEFRKKRAESRRGTHHSESTKKKMSIAAKGNQSACGALRSIEARQRIGLAHLGHNSPKVFPIEVIINQTTLLWNDGFSALKKYLIQEYQLDISTVGLQRLCAGVYQESRKAKERGISLQIKRKSHENNKR